MTTPPPQPAERQPGYLRRRLLEALAAMLLIALADVPAAAVEKSTPRSVGFVVYDALIERPFGVVETIVGAGVTVIAYPLALGSGRSHLVVDRCIRAPARYTFVRPLGDFSEGPDNGCGAVGLGWGTIRASLSLVERPLAFLFGRSPLARDVPEPREELEI